MPAHKKQLVHTIKDRCRVCYTCVRECPVKAIRIANGQAEVIDKRCIGCGNCVKVCSQNAKEFLQAIPDILELLKGEQKVAAIVAPSFPAEFTELKDYRTIVGLLRKLGFDYVSEVAFGADLVAIKYTELLMDISVEGHISSDCPAITFYIEHYFPHLVPYLAEIASPMVAMARVMKKKYGDDLKLVFIGPCIAKKAESLEVDEVLTFRELRQWIRESGLDWKDITPSEFDPPFAGKGAVFPLTRGLLQNTNIPEDLCDGSVIVADGRVNFREAIREFENGFIRHMNLELLCCEGCIMGPGMSPEGKPYMRRAMVSNYVKQKLQNADDDQWLKDIEVYKTLDLSHTFESNDRRIPNPTRKEIDEVLKSMGKLTEADHLDCGSCGYDSCEEHAIAIIKGFAETEMCLPYAIEKLHKSIADLAVTNDKLASAQQALKQSEKLAHMGQLSAGIAHELNNPLGIITMYSNILIDEASPDSPLCKDLELIVEQTDRCRKIVGGLLNFARKNQVNYAEIDIENLLERSRKSVVKPENVDITLTSRLLDPHVMLDSDQMIQVFTNLIKNAIEAMENGGRIDILLEDKGAEVSVCISDNGSGIAPENMEKIFTPFFTTKGLGKGTGLGLPIIYGIIKMHKGRVEVTSNADKSKGETGTTFRIILPKKRTDI